MPITANAILYPSAKLMDLINVTGMGFTLKLLLSGKLKKIIENSRSTGLQFYRSDLIYKNDIVEDYWVLNSFEIDMDFVDIKKSNFVLRKRKDGGGTYLSDVNFTTLDGFTDKINIDNLEGKLYLNKIEIKDQVKSHFFTLLNVEGGAKYVGVLKIGTYSEDIDVVHKSSSGGQFISN